MKIRNPERREKYYRVISRFFPRIIVTDSFNGKITIEQLYLDKENKVRLEIGEIPDLIKILSVIDKNRKKHKLKEVD